MKSNCYNFKGNEKRRAGFIADEVEKIIPTIATAESMNYLELIPYLVGCIQTLNTEMLNIRGCIQTLNTEMNMLKKELREKKS